MRETRFSGLPHGVVRVGRCIALVAVGVVLAAGCTSQPSGDGNHTSPTSSDKPGPAPKAAVLALAPVGSTPISPATPVSVTVANGTIKSVTVTNAASGVVVTGAFDAHNDSWTSNEPLGYGATYKVVADAVGTDGKPVEQTETVTTLRPGSTSTPDLIPTPAETSVGVGQPIVVRFDKAVTDRAAVEKALQVTSTPTQVGGWYWISGTEVHYRPSVYWQSGSTVTLNANLYGVDFGGNVYGGADHSITFHVHDALIAKADGNTEQMQVYDNGNLIKTLPISLGKGSTPTHTGPHVISDREPSIVMDSCSYGVCKGQPGYYSETVYLDERISDDGEFVHSAPWSVGQQGSTNVSHGCVNLSPANAQWFYNTFGIGDVVEISNSGGPALPVWDIYGDWELTWAQWQAGSALSGSNN